MYSRLPLLEEASDDFIFQYNKMHAEEHQEMASWINALAKAKGLDYTITYYTLPPMQKENMRDFFEINWKQHQFFYDILNKIGSYLTIPIFIFPKNYPSYSYDLSFEAFLKFERDMHNLIWRGIDAIKSNL